MSLMNDPRPVMPEAITLHCGDVSLALEACRDARLVVADPPWPYNQTAVRGNAADEYECPTLESIVSVLDRAYDSAADDAYLFTWATWPTLSEWLAAGGAGPRWRYLTGARGIRPAGSASGFTSAATLNRGFCGARGSRARSGR